MLNIRFSYIFKKVPQNLRCVFKKWSLGSVTKKVAELSDCISQARSREKLEVEPKDAALPKESFCVVEISKKVL